MIQSLALILLLLFVGETVAASVGWPVPGAALGLFGLAVYLGVTGGPDADLERLFDGLAPNVPMLFVPAAAGVIANLDLLASSWLYVLVAVVLGTGATLMTAGLCAQALLGGARRPA